MDNDMLPTSPFGQSNIPYQEIPAEYTSNRHESNIETTVGPVALDKSTKHLKTYILILGMAVAALFILFLAVLMMLSRKPQAPAVVPVVHAPTPTPTVTPNASVLPQHFIDRVNTLEKNAQETNMQELELSFPQITWKIRY